MIELKGKPVADMHKEKLKKHIDRLAEKGIRIGMAIVIVGDDMASHMYAKFMKKTAENMGFAATIYDFPADTQQNELERCIQALGEDPTIHGILPMMPMPSHIDVESVLHVLNPKKDLDGLTTENIGRVSSGRDGFVPCTPKACLAILDYYKIPIEGKHVCVVGRSGVVGRPVAGLLLDRHGTITVCHSRTQQLTALLRNADIVVAAVGRAHFITADMLKEGAVVIDVGINDLDGATVGDVDYDGCAPIVSAITPVPGGVGSVTTTMTLEALYKAYVGLYHA